MDRNRTPATDLVKSDTPSAWHRAGLALGIATLSAALLPWSSAQAFCGFYVSGADASLYSNATMVVMMREGRRTVLSMQNNYQGPPEDFAMVVPVPMILQEENVKTLPKEIFERIDQLAAPRLVEYWEQDPCVEFNLYEGFGRGLGGVRRRAAGAPASSAGLGVTVEAQFAVGEYDIVILSANDSSGLDTWLRQEEYNIPEGAEAVLRPYVEQGTKFFVAKVDAERATFENGVAILSPLRFHYDTEEFSLPVRLGLLNSSGQQDLIVHILARGQRYEVANYANTTIPTNIIAKHDVRENFGNFYDLLFRRASATAPRTVVTEYAWDASSCDPCPVPALNPSEIASLGADVLPGASASLSRRRPGFFGGGFVLTRLHYRYGPDGLNEDLVFRAAPPIVGGRGMPNAEGVLTEEGSQRGSMNNFQGRYVMLNPWQGKVECENPQRGRWGGPPSQGGGGMPPVPRPIASPNQALRGLSDGPALTSVGPLVETDIPAIGVRAGVAEPMPATDPGPPRSSGTTPTEASGPETPASPSEAPSTTSAPGSTTGDGGCASCAVGGKPTWTLPAVALALCLRRRRFRNG